VVATPTRHSKVKKRSRWFPPVTNIRVQAKSLVYKDMTVCDIASSCGGAAWDEGEKRAWGMAGKWRIFYLTSNSLADGRCECGKEDFFDNITFVLGVV